MRKNISKNTKLFSDLEETLSRAITSVFTSYLNSSFYLRLYHASSNAFL